MKKWKPSRHGFRFRDGTINLLYARTNDKRCLDFTAEIVRQWEDTHVLQLTEKSVVNVSKRLLI